MADRTPLETHVMDRLADEMWLRLLRGDPKHDPRTFNADPERPKSRQERRADARRKAKGSTDDRT